MFQRSPTLILVYRRRQANDSPTCPITHAWYRDAAALRQRENSENRIEAGQRGLRTRSSLSLWLPGPQGGGGSRLLQWYGPSVVSPGEWGDGRRAGFRCQCPSGRGGSSPPSPTDVRT